MSPDEYRSTNRWWRTLPKYASSRHSFWSLKRECMDDARSYLLPSGKHGHRKTKRERRLAIQRAKDVP